MQNSVFCMTNDAEKAKKLEAIIKSKTRYELSEEQIRCLSLAIRIGRQYSINIHTSPTEFCCELVLLRNASHRDRGTVVFGQVLFDDNGTVTLYDETRAAAAIAVRCTETEKEFRYCGNEIHIFLPGNSGLEGVADHEKQKT